MVIALRETHHAQILGRFTIFTIKIIKISQNYYRTHVDRIRLNNLFDRFKNKTYNYIQLVF
jgi:hypothetical protein